MRKLLAVLAVLAMLAIGCGDDGDDDGDGATGGGNGDTTTTAGGPDLSGTIEVFAAASLTDAFEDVASAFEEANPDATVEFNFGGSSDLVAQITEGAPGDVFASANQSNMDKAIEADALEGEPKIFVRNNLQIAVPPGNPAGVTGLADFANEDLLIGLCAEEVPCGDFGRAALEAAGVEASIDTNEPDVRALLTKVEEGELDAGIVYTTDVQASEGGVEGLDIPDDQNQIATYPIATLGEAGELDLAEAFVDFVLSSEGQTILTEFGFLEP